MCHKVRKAISENVNYIIFKTNHLRMQGKVGSVYLIEGYVEYFGQITVKFNEGHPGLLVNYSKRIKC